MDGSTGGNHGGSVVIRKPPEGHGPEIAYDDSVNSSINENNTQRNTQPETMALPNVSQKFLQNFEDTDDSADDREDNFGNRKKRSLIRVDEQQKRRRNHDRKASMPKGKMGKKGPKAKHHRWKT